MFVNEILLPCFGTVIHAGSVHTRYVTRYSAYKATI